MMAFWSSNISLLTHGHYSESREGWDTKYSDIISSFFVLYSIHINSLFLFGLVFK